MGPGVGAESLGSRPQGVGPGAFSWRISELGAWAGFNFSEVGRGQANRSILIFFEPCMVVKMHQI